MYEYVEKFERYMSENGVSANTSASYKRDVDSFVSYLDVHEVFSFSDVLPKDIKQYADHLRESGKSPSTVTRNIASLKAFYKYLMSADAVMINPVVNIKAEKTDKKMPEILTVGEVRQLLSAPNVNTAKGCRDRAMLELLYATGMRTSELLNIECKDINTEYGFVVIKNTDSERTVPFYEIAGQCVEEYIDNVRGQFLKSRTDVLFLNKSGKCLSRQGFWKILKAYAESANIKKEVTPHTIRHSFAVHMLENGVSVKSLQEIMGYADVSSTQMYVQLMKKHFNDEYGIYHPRVLDDKK